MTVTAHAFALNTSSDERAVLDIFRHRNSLRQVKHFLQFATDWAVIRISGHNVGHIFPPTLADFSAGYRIPAFFRFNLYHGKQQITRFRHRHIERRRRTNRSYPDDSVGGLHYPHIALFAVVCRWRNDLRGRRGVDSGSFPRQTFQCRDNRLCHGFRTNDDSGCRIRINVWNDTL